MTDTPTLDLLLTANAELFDRYETWANFQIKYLAGTLDDPDSFDKDGGTTGARGYYPVQNVNGQIEYIPCLARVIALSESSQSLGGAIQRFENAVNQQNTLSFGNPAEGTIYKLGSGLLEAQDAAVIQIINRDVPGHVYSSTLLNISQFKDDGKPVTLQVIKSRGNGILGDPGYHKTTVQGDRLFVLGIYGAASADGIINLGIGGHAGYLTWTQEYNTPVPANGEIDAMFHLVGGTTKKIGSSPRPAVGDGGIQGNCLGQVYFSGPNSPQHDARDVYRALVEIGKGTGTCDDMQQVGFQDSPLVDRALYPDKIKAGGIEFSNGNMYLSHTDLDRRRIATIKYMGFAAAPQGANGAWTSTLRSTKDVVELTVTVGVDPVVNFAPRLTYDTPLTAVPFVTGSYYCGINPDTAKFEYNGSNLLRAQIVLTNGSMPANSVYVFTLRITQP